VIDPESDLIGTIRGASINFARPGPPTSTSALAAVTVCEVRFDAS
jgi:hypothetical protein